MAGYIKYKVSKDKEEFVADISIFGYALPNSLTRDLYLVEFIELTLTEEEKQFAVDKCNADPVRSKIARYFGDEAKRIIGNWIEDPAALHYQSSK